MYSSFELLKHHFLHETHAPWFSHLQLELARELRSGVVTVVVIGPLSRAAVLVAQNYNLFVMQFLSSFVLMIFSHCLVA